MLIRPPRNDGEYPDRDLDCQESIETAFLKHISATAFVDLHKVRETISPDAVSAGWTQADVDGAIKELVRCYALNVAQIRGNDFVTASAISRERLNR
jgi:hypothetical protein